MSTDSSPHESSASVRAADEKPLAGPLAPVESSLKTPLMSHEERRKLIEAPFPIVNVIGRKSYGGVELPGLPYDTTGTTITWIGMDELYRGIRKPTLGDYDGEDA